MGRWRKGCSQRLERPSRQPAARVSLIAAQRPLIVGLRADVRATVQNSEPYFGFAPADPLHSSGVGLPAHCRKGDHLLPEYPQLGRLRNVRSIAAITLDKAQQALPHSERE